MGLFSTLLASSATEAGTSSNSASSASTLAIPTVIQLYSGSPIVLEKGASKSRKFASLSYQAVQAAASLAEGEQRGGALLSKQQKETAALHPNLGVWNCRVATKTRNAGADNSTDQQPLIDYLLRTIPSASNDPIFCFTVDLSDPYKVEPTVSLLQDALVRFLIAQQPADGTTATPIDPSATTSLYQLKSTNFGLAVNDQESEDKMTVTPDEKDRKTRISLMICALVPARDQLSATGDVAGSTGGGYKEKQAEALVHYHLRKYAASLDAVLCFVRPDQSAPEEGEQETQAITALTMGQLSFVWSQLAQGKSVWKEGQVKIEGDGAEEGESEETGIYGPGKQHEDLIESVLLRNAQYPGQWDAAKDSLWVALPPRDAAPVDASASDDNATAGDEGWLNELSASLASEVKSPPPSATKGEAGSAKTPNDAAVSSFFESLLKP